MKATEIAKVETEVQISAVAALAGEIWRDHYTPIIGAEQVEYMLDKFQSEEAIGEQIASGCEYYLVLDGGENAGYIAVVPDRSARNMKLSKIYIHKSRRGRGLGKAALRFAEDLCSRCGYGKLWLTVNKHNAGSIQWYERMGFVNAGPAIVAIGGGFVMDDYIMEKPLESG